MECCSETKHLRETKSVCISQKLSSNASPILGDFPNLLLPVYSHHLDIRTVWNTVIIWRDPPPPIRDYVICARPLHLEIEILATGPTAARSLNDEHILSSVVFHLLRDNSRMAQALKKIIR